MFIQELKFIEAIELYNATITNNLSRHYQKWQNLCRESES